jgi:ubiquinone/menaquinone biosynthesis C-methylase UbiE
MEYTGKRRNYLEENRYRFHNADYIEFLITKVWKISKPARIVDFGCGLGYLGLSLMRFLPEGSSYTGIDISEILIEQAQDVFKNLRHDVKFIVADGYDAPFEDSHFDMAVCQAFLMHLPEPEKAIKEMIRTTASGGLVMAVEANGNAANPLLHIAEMDLAETTDLGFLQKNYEYNRKSSGRDGNIGLKLPAIFHKMGLKNVGSRMSDLVKCILPPIETEDQELLHKAVAQDIGRTISDDTANHMEKHFIKQGFSQEEAQAQIARERKLNHTFRDNGRNMHTVWATALNFSYGWVADQ